MTAYETGDQKHPHFTVRYLGWPKYERPGVVMNPPRSLLRGELINCYLTNCPECLHGLAQEDANCIRDAHMGSLCFLKYMASVDTF